ncbi:MAG: NmrA family NAD(P)-binding protein [Silvibacterium sp.]|nr:NmrA family NAD(P)-binding protein [Silvibacterium sp.]
MSILVVGSSGTVGSEIIKLLALRGADFSALVQNPKAKVPNDVKTIQGDITEISSMRAALRGIDTLFLLNPVVPDELNRALLTLDLALEAPVKGVVYLSMFHADVFLDCPHACAKYATELMIHKLQVPATILRPNYFFQNDGKTVVEKGEYPMPIGPRGVSMVDVRDIAEVAAVALMKRDQSPGPLPIETIEIHGPDVINSESAIALWSEVLGKKVRYPGDDLHEAERRFSALMPSAMAYDIVAMYQGFHKYGMIGSRDAIDRLTALLGRPLRTYRAYAEECADAAAHRREKSAA